jgi:4-hydroxybenzoyl-CoA thioesterase
MSAVKATVHPFERPMLIRFAHCDPAGIVFFPQYLVMVNNLVEDWVSDALGVPYVDVVLLGLSVERLGTKSITMQLGCRQGGEARFRMRQVIVFTDLDTHRAIDIPADLRAAIERFQSA